MFLGVYLPSRRLARRRKGRGAPLSHRRPAATTAAASVPLLATMPFLLSNGCGLLIKLSAATAHITFARNIDMVNIVPALEYSRVLFTGLPHAALEMLVRRETEGWCAAA